MLQPTSRFIPVVTSGTRSEKGQPALHFGKSKDMTAINLLSFALNDLNLEEAKKVASGLSLKDIQDCSIQFHAHRIVEKGKTELLKVLLDAGLNPSTVVGKQSLLATAAWNNHLDMVELLLAKKARLEPGWYSRRFKNEWIPLQSVAWDGSHEITKLLLDAGAKVDTTDAVGRTPLLTAATESQRPGSIEVARLLLEHHANPNYQARITGSPLGWAVRNGNLEMVTLLLKYGADPLLAEKNGRRQTPLAQAQESLKHARDDEGKSRDEAIITALKEAAAKKTS